MSHTNLARFLESYFRHRWLNLIPLVLMIILAAAWVLTSKAEYIAHGTMHVQTSTLLATLTADPQNQTAWTSAADTTTGEINSLLQTDAFVRSILEGSDLEPELQKGPRAVENTLSKTRWAIWVNKLGPNMVLISAKAESPAVAQQLSAGVMQKYVQWRVNVEGQDTSAQTYFARLITSYQTALDTARQDLQIYLTQHPDPVRGERPTEETFQINRLQTAVLDATTRLDDAVHKVQSVQLAGTRAVLNAQEAYSVIDAPQVPAEPATSRRKQLLSVGVFMLVGLLLSLTVVVGTALFDATLRFPADVEQQISLPLLGAIPDVAAGVGVFEDAAWVQAGELVAAAQGA